MVQSLMMIFLVVVVMLKMATAGDLALHDLAECASFWSGGDSKYSNETVRSVRVAH